MARAIWNGAVIAESGAVETVEGNLYFPRAAVKADFLRDSSHTTVCGWKGTARYHDIVVQSRTDAAAAWYYPDPGPAAANIRDHIAFWRGVTVET
jgi:uncharacterized protein (DUF427 family)